MSAPPEEPLFASIGQVRRRTPTPPAFATFIAIGLAAAIGTFVWRWTHPPERVHAVRVDLVVTPGADALEEQAAWSARRAAAAATSTPVPAAPAPPAPPATP